MSRDQPRSTSNLMTGTAAGNETLDGASITACSIWGRADTFASSDGRNKIFALGCQGSGNAGFAAGVNGTTSKFYVEGRPFFDNSTLTLAHTTVLSLNTWYHFGAMIDWGNDTIYAVVNGSVESASPGTWTVSTFEANLTGGSGTMRIGQNSHSSILTSDAWDGPIAHAAFWRDVLFTQADWTALASGVSPLVIRPGNLKLYYPLWGIHSPEIELIANHQLTITGTVPAGPTEPPAEDMFWSLSDPDRLDEELVSGGNIAALSARLLQMRKVA